MHPAPEDDEFTPGGIKNWTYERYEKKLDDLAQVILSIPGKETAGHHWTCRSGEQECSGGSDR